jgi:integrase/recombinase XerD
MAEADIHNMKRRYERVLYRIKNSSEILDKNKETLLKFHDYLLSESIGFAKLERYFIDMIKFEAMLKNPFEKADEQDIRRVVSEINQKDLSEHTKRGFKLIVRRFYRFVRGCDKDDPNPKEVKWISLKISTKHSKLPEELLSEKEFISIIQHCDTLRDKTLISTIAESGARVGEIATMKIKHISFEKYGARLTVNGKTGMRKILVVSSSSFLQRWINEHPKNDNPESYLWYNPQGEFLCYNRIAAILKKAARRAGIKKRMHLHLLRHSRATQLASIMSEASMKQYFGWVQGSDMAAVYVHMSGKDTDQAVLQANGIKIEKDEVESTFKPINCERCQTNNPPTNKVCQICSFVLDKKLQNNIIEEDQIVNEKMRTIFQDEDVMNLIRRKLATQ